MNYKRIAYHRVSDDSVSAMTFPNWEVSLVIEEYQLTDDIDHIWTRDNNGNVDWEWHRILGTRERIELSDFPYVGWVTRKN